MGQKPLSFDFRRMREQNGLPSLDTGSTYIHLVRPLYNLFTNAFSDFCAESQRHCGQKQEFQECFFYMAERHGSLDQFMASFPTVRFGFNGRVELELEPRDYMVLNSEVETFYCPGFQPLDRTVFGTAFMRNRDVYFDKEKRAIGFVRATLDAATVQTDERPDLSDDWPDLQREMSELGWEDSAANDSPGWLARVRLWVESPFVWGFLGMAVKTVGLVALALAGYVVCFVVGWGH